MRACSTVVIIPDSGKYGKRCCTHRRCTKHSCKKRCKKPCQKQKRCPKSRFVEHIFPVVTADGNWQCLPAQDTSNMSIYSYAVINRSGVPIETKVEISPNAADFAKDVQEDVASNGKAVLVPLRFLKYTRLCIKAKNSADMAHVQVYYQGQLR